MERCQILGVTIANETMEMARDNVAHLLAASGPRALYFVNAHTLNHACSDPSYRQVLSRANVIYGDGTGVRWAARARGISMKANVNGTDLVPLTLRTGENIRCYLVGSAPDRIETILAETRSLFPSVEFVGAHHGYIDDAQSAAVIEDINRSGANLVLVGMGNPLQEQWIDRHGRKVPDALMVAVGGLFEYWGGGLVRAPFWMRKLGIEWVHLMLRQPWKARRYLIGNPLFIFRMLRDAAADRRHVSASYGGTPQCQPTVSPITDGSPRKPHEQSAEELAASSPLLDAQDLKSAS